MFWVSVKLFTIGRADRAIIVDATPPEKGSVFDGPLYGEDLAFTKDDYLVMFYFVFYFSKEIFALKII